MADNIFNLSDLLTGLIADQLDPLHGAKIQPQSQPHPQKKQTVRLKPQAGQTSPYHASCDRNSSAEAEIQFGCFFIRLMKRSRAELYAGRGKPVKLGSTWGVPWEVRGAAAKRGAGCVLGGWSKSPGEMCVVASLSPLRGLLPFYFQSTAYAVGCILAPLRG
jgi:hypothetical protein